MSSSSIRYYTLKIIFDRLVPQGTDPPLQAPRRQVEIMEQELVSKITHSHIFAVVGDGSII
jgi:hypothetical protein